MRVSAQVHVGSSNTWSSSFGKVPAGHGAASVAAYTVHSDREAILGGIMADERLLLDQQVLVFRLTAA